MSWTRKSARPFSRALPRRLSEKGPSNILGKIVKTSMRSLGRPVRRTGTAPSGGRSRFIDLAEPRRQPDQNAPRRQVDAQDHVLYGRDKVFAGLAAHDEDVVGAGRVHVFQKADDFAAFGDHGATV